MRRNQLLGLLLAIVGFLGGCGEDPPVCALNGIKASHGGGCGIGPRPIPVCPAGLELVDVSYNGGYDCAPPVDPPAIELECNEMFSFGLEASVRLPHYVALSQLTGFALRLKRDGNVVFYRWLSAGDLSLLARGDVVGAQTSILYEAQSHSLEIKTGMHGVVELAVGHPSLGVLIDEVTIDFDGCHPVTEYLTFAF